MLLLNIFYGNTVDKLYESSCTFVLSYEGKNLLSYFRTFGVQLRVLSYYVRVLVPSFVDYHNKIPSYESTKVMSYLRIIHTRTLSFLSVHVRK